MPPPLFFILQLPFTQLAYAIFPVAIANGIISGSFTFCSTLFFSELYAVTYWDWCRYSLRLHALCVSWSYSFRNAHHWCGSLLDYTIPSFLNIWKKWKSIILLIITRTLNSDMVLPVRIFLRQCNPQVHSIISLYRQNLGLCIQYSPSGMIQAFNYQINFGRLSHIFCLILSMLWGNPGFILFRNYFFKFPPFTNRFEIDLNSTFSLRRVGMATINLSLWIGRYLVSANFCSSTAYRDS